MAEGLLEYEIRRLPDVLAAAVDGTAVTVLVQPTADADAVQAVIGAMLATASLERTVTVLGGTSAADVRGRRVAPLVTGGVAGAGLLVSAAAAAALTGGLPMLPILDQPAEQAPVAPAVAAPAPSPAPSGGPSRFIVPGGKPDWASSQPPIELPPVVEEPVVELAIAEATAPPPEPKRPALAKLAQATPPPLTPTAVVPETPVVPEPPVVLAPPVVEGPPLVEVPTAVRDARDERDGRPDPEPEVEIADQDDDRHRNNRGQGHAEHGNGRGRGHEDGGKP